MRKTKILRIGIASRAQMKARTLAVARGERRRAADEPKVWFTSTKALADCLAARTGLRSTLIRRLRQSSIVSS